MAMNEYNENKIKITIYNTHFARIHKDIWHKLGSKVGSRNRTKWIKKQCENQFGFSLNSKEDIEKLHKAIEPPFYEDLADWLREKIREELRE